MGSEAGHRPFRFLIGPAEITDDAHKVVVFCEVEHSFQYPVEHGWIRLSIPIHPELMVHLDHGFKDLHNPLTAAVGRDFTAG